MEFSRFIQSLQINIIDILYANKVRHLLYFLYFPKLFLYIFHI